MARADKIAARMADDILAREPMIHKSAGRRAEVVRMVFPAAVVVAELERAVKDYGRRMTAMVEKLSAMTRQVSDLSAVHPVPPVPDIQRGWRQFNAEQDVVGLVPKQAAPKVMNGYGRADREATYQPPPGWHPENEGPV